MYNFRSGQMIRLDVMRRTEKAILFNTHGSLYKIDSTGFWVPRSLIKGEIKRFTDDTTKTFIRFLINNNKFIDTELERYILLDVEEYKQYKIDSMERAKARKRVYEDYQDEQDKAAENFRLESMKRSGLYITLPRV